MRKYKLPPELAQLSDLDLRQVETWLDRFGYREVQDLVRERFRVTISIDKLYRHFHRVQAARLSSHPTAPPLAATDLLAILNADPNAAERVNIPLLQRRAFELASRTDHTPSDLKQLLDICTYTDRAELARKRAELDERAANQRSLRHQLRERELLLEHHANPAASGLTPPEPARASAKDTVPDPEENTVGLERRFG